MWITVLVMAIAVSLEPFRIGMTVLMLHRPRPVLQLLAFLMGGFVMAATVGLVVLFLFRPAQLGSAHFTLPNVQIAIGVLALVMAALLVLGVAPAPSSRPRHAASLAARRCGSPAWRVWGSRCRPSIIWRYWPSSSRLAPLRRRSSVRC